MQANKSSGQKLVRIFHFYAAINHQQEKLEAAWHQPRRKVKRWTANMFASAIGEHSSQELAYFWGDLIQCMLKKETSRFQ
jgi:hypothetical protein